MHRKYSQTVYMYDFTDTDSDTVARPLRTELGLGREAVRRNSVFVECCSMVLLACNVMLECSETACACLQLGVSAARLCDEKP